MGVMRRAGSTIASWTYRMEKTAGVWWQSSNRRKASPEGRCDFWVEWMIAAPVMALGGNGFDSTDQLLTGKGFSDIRIGSLFHSPEAIDLLIFRGANNDGNLFCDWMLL